MTKLKIIAPRNFAGPVNNKYACANSDKVPINKIATDK